MPQGFSLQDAQVGFWRQALGHLDNSFGAENLPDQFRNTLIAGGDKGGYWKSWVARAETDPHAARIVGMYRRRPEHELYDVTKDPYELENIAADPANAELMADLRRRLDAWMQSQGDRGVETCDI